MRGSAARFWTVSSSKPCSLHAYRSSRFRSNVLLTTSLPHRSLHPQPSTSSPNTALADALETASTTFNELIPSDPSPSNDAISNTPDARFETLASSPTSTPSNLLQIHLSASQALHTRRGTLVSVSGATAPAHQTTCTLSLLSPVKRLPLRVPFLYQRVVSTAPISLLVSERASNANVVVVRLDGRTDWRVVKRDGIIAWTGERLSVLPEIGEAKFGIARMAASTLTGRGLVALAGAGGVHSMRLRQGEEYIVHPGHVLAYEIGSSAPAPYRFPSSTLRLQVPNIDLRLGEYLPTNVQTFFRNLRQSDTYRSFANVMFTLRTWSRRLLHGDRVYMRFYGPTTLLLQSRAPSSGLRDALTRDDVAEFADAPAGAFDGALRSATQQNTPATTSQSDETPKEPESETVSYATVGSDGKVSFGR